MNKVATDAGYIHRYDAENPGWRITQEGREVIGQTGFASEEMLNVDTLQTESILSNSARGRAFELYILNFLKSVHPYHSWYHQGVHKNNERGLDFIGHRIGDTREGPTTIGVQVKFHAPNAAPSQVEWLKFLAGCFTRRVQSSIFITSGILTSEQRREASEAQVTVIESRSEIARLSRLHGLAAFELFDEASEDELQQDQSVDTYR